MCGSVLVQVEYILYVVQVVFFVFQLQCCMYCVMGEGYVIGSFVGDFYVFVFGGEQYGVVVYYVIGVYGGEVDGFLCLCVGLFFVFVDCYFLEVLVECLGYYFVYV